MGRAFGFIATLIVVAIALYLYSTQLRSVSAPGATGPGGAANPTGVANLVGVKGDLVSIANAERQYYASEGHYASLDDLTSGHYLTVSGSRPPYTYDVETSDTGFEVTASRSDGGSPEQLSIDQSMQIQMSN
jgi:hypothetical protein